MTYSLRIGRYLDFKIRVRQVQPCFEILVVQAEKLLLHLVVRHRVMQSAYRGAVFFFIRKGWNGRNHHAAIFTGDFLRCKNRMSKKGEFRESMCGSIRFEHKIPSQDGYNLSREVQDFKVLSQM